MPFLALAFFIVLGCLILGVLGYTVWVALPRIRKKRAGAHPLDADFEAEITPPARTTARTSARNTARNPARTIRTPASDQPALTKSNRQRLAKYRRRSPAKSRAPANDLITDAEEHSIGDATLLRSYGMRPQKNAQAANTPEHVHRRKHSAIEPGNTGGRAGRIHKGSVAAKKRVEKTHLKAVRSPEREAS